MAATDSYQQALDALHAARPQLLRGLPIALVAGDPHLREYLPLDPSEVTTQLLDAVDNALAALPPTARTDVATFTGTAGSILHHAGRQLRKYAFPPQWWPALTRALLHSITDTLPPAAAATLSPALHPLVRTLHAGAHAPATHRITTPDGLTHTVDLPARIGATVVEVERRSRRITVVRLIADSPLGYAPGASVAVSTPQAPGLWRRLSPAIPSNPDGMVEFHIAAVPGGLVSPQIVTHTQPGDRWVLADPERTVALDLPGRDILLLAGSTGYAPVRCLLLAHMGDLRMPRVHLFLGAEYPGELYDLPLLWHLASTTPWLTVQPVTRHERDDHTVRSRTQQPPRGLNQRLTGRLDEVVASFGTWSDRQILIAGSPAMMDTTRRTLLARGTPPQRIHTLAPAAPPALQDS